MTVLGAWGAIPHNALILVFAYQVLIVSIQASACELSRDICGRCVIMSVLCVLRDAELTYGLKRWPLIYLLAKGVPEGLYSPPSPIRTIGSPHLVVSRGRIDQTWPFPVANLPGMVKSCFFSGRISMSQCMVYWKSHLKGVAREV